MSCLKLPFNRLSPLTHDLASAFHAFGNVIFVLSSGEELPDYYFLIDFFVLWKSALISAYHSLAIQFICMRFTYLNFVFKFFLGVTVYMKGLRTALDKALLPKLTRTKCNMPMQLAHSRPSPVG